MAKPTGRPRGRPPLNIDERQVVALAGIGCTYREMAAILDCSLDVLERRFSVQIEKAYKTMRMSLRRHQLRLAESGNVTMCIWLGKQYLGQSDRQEYTERKIDYATLTDEELEALASAESIG
jgi:hypothetical protein